MSSGSSPTYDDNYQWIRIIRGKILHFLRHDKSDKAIAGFPCYDLGIFVMDALNKNFRTRIKLRCRCIFYANIVGVLFSRETTVLMFDKVKHQCSGVQKNKNNIGLSDISQITIFISE